MRERGEILPRAGRSTRRGGFPHWGSVRAACKAALPLAVPGPGLQMREKRQITYSKRMPSGVHISLPKDAYPDTSVWLWPPRSRYLHDICVHL